MEAVRIIFFLYHSCVLFLRYNMIDQVTTKEDICPGLVIIFLCSHNQT